MAPSYTSRAASAATTPRAAQVGQKHSLVVVAALISLGVVVYDIHNAGANRAVAVKELGAVILLWALVFVLAEFSDEAGSSVAVFLLLVFLVARRGAVTAVLGNAAGSSSSSQGVASSVSQVLKGI